MMNAKNIRQQSRSWPIWILPNFMCWTCVKFFQFDQQKWNGTLVSGWHIWMWRRHMIRLNAIHCWKLSCANKVCHARTLDHWHDFTKESDRCSGIQQTTSNPKRSLTGSCVQSRPFRQVFGGCHVIMDAKADKSRRQTWSTRKFDTGKLRWRPLFTYEIFAGNLSHGWNAVWGIRPRGIAAQGFQNNNVDNMPVAVKIASKEVKRFYEEDTHKITQIFG